MKQAEVVWSPQAEESYLEILKFIIEKWNQKAALKFDSSVEELISKIASFRHICPESAIVHLKRCVISKQTSMIYQSIDNKTIEIVTFFDNRSNHPY